MSVSLERRTALAALVSTVGLSAYGKDRESTSANAGPAGTSGSGGMANVMEAGAAGDGVSDDTQAFIKAFGRENTTIYLPPGHYILNQTIPIWPHQQIIGASRASVQITMKNRSQYAFRLWTEVKSYNYDVDCGLVIAGITLNAKYGIQLNQSGEFSRHFQLQGALKAPVFRNCTFAGVYKDIDDNKRDSAAYPSLDELFEFGVGIYAVKMFDALIQSCLFQDNGIGLYMDGCDINKIDICRFSQNARHIHIYSHDTYGWSNKVDSCDMLANRRRGAIFDDSTVGTYIGKNYFETYSAAGEFYTGKRVQDTLIINNRFDPNRSHTPEVSCAPTYGVLFSGNLATFGIAYPPVKIDVSPEHYYGIINGLGNNFLMKFCGNSGSIQNPSCPFVELDYNNPRLFNCKNPKVLLGRGTQSSFPFVVSPVTKRHALLPTGPEVIVTFDSQPADLNVLVLVQARAVNVGEDYGQIRWGDVVVWSGRFGFSKTTEAEVVEFTIRKPDQVNGPARIDVELANANAEYESIELRSVDYLLGTAPPAGDRCTYRAGDRMRHLQPEVGAPKGWICVKSGAPGTWVSEGNL